MKTCKNPWLLTLLIVPSVSAVAGHDDGNRYDAFEKRLDRQYWRIEAGIRDGQLTRKEAGRLYGQQRHLTKLMRKFKHDGYLDTQERQTLHQALDQASERIYRLKHNHKAPVGYHSGPTGPAERHLDYEAARNHRPREVITVRDGYGKPPSRSQPGRKLTARWSTNGPLGGAFRYCLAINDPADADNALWRDNYLCFNTPDHGFIYSYSGAIKGLNCRVLNIKGGVWRDNYLCNLSNEFAWFPRALRGGYRCVRLIEPADPNPRGNGSSGYSNHFCLKN